MRIFKIRYYSLFSALFSVGIYFGLPYLNGLSFLDILESQDLTLFLYYMLLSLFFASSIVLLIYIYAVAFFKKDVNKLPYNKATARFTLLYVALTSCIILIMSLFGEYSFTRYIWSASVASSDFVGTVIYVIDGVSCYQLFILGIIIGSFAANINAKKHIKGIYLTLTFTFFISVLFLFIKFMSYAVISEYIILGQTAILFLLATVNFFTYFKTSTVVSKITYLNLLVFPIVMILNAAHVDSPLLFFYNETILSSILSGIPIFLCSLVFFQILILFLKNKPKEVPPVA